MLRALGFSLARAKIGDIGYSRVAPTYPAKPNPPSDLQHHNSISTLTTAMAETVGRRLSRSSVICYMRKTNNYQRGLRSCSVPQCAVSMTKAD
jgi:hypothetical protein